MTPLWFWDVPQSDMGEWQLVSITEGYLLAGVLIRKTRADWVVRILT